jgi:hypothetical protein
MTDNYLKERWGHLRQLRLSRSQIAAIFVTSIFAIVAAFAKIVIGLANGKGWDWVGFFQDVIQFAFIAAVVAGVSAMILAWDAERHHEALVTRTLRMMLIALHGSIAEVFERSNSFKDVDAAQMIKNKAASLSAVSGNFLDFNAKLNEFVESRESHAPAPDDSPYSAQFKKGMGMIDDALAGVLALAWGQLRQAITFSYDPDGLRRQRSIILSHIVADLAQISSTSGATLANEAIVARDRAVQYLASVAGTDAAIESYLVHGNLKLSPGAKVGAALSTTLSTYPVDLSRMACTSDRVDFLISYCDEVFGDQPKTQEIVAIVPASHLFSYLSVEVSSAAQLASAFSDLAEKAIGTKAGYFAVARRNR